MANPPQAILALNEALLHHPKKPKSYKFSGIVGDAAHSYGYHLAPNQLPGSDYSLQTARDEAGAKKHPNLASAWDLSFNSSDMKTVTKRLLAAAKAHDPRMHGVREFCGTLNGSQTYPWDLHADASEGVGTWDDSHLWHVHISFYRDTCDDLAAIKGVVDVICGVAAPTPKPKPYVPPKYPRKLGNPYKQGDRGPDVKLLQQRLVKLGYAGKVNAATWCDGYYGPETVAAVNHYRKSKHWPQTGRIGRPTWNALFK